jgi:NAD(P) transhydrogenase subunit alpha
VSEAGKDIIHHGVTVAGLSNPPSAMPTHASFLYSRNVFNFLTLILTDGELTPDFDDEIVAGCCVVRAGEIVHAPTRDLVEGKVNP